MARMQGIQLAKLPLTKAQFVYESFKYSKQFIEKHGVSLIVVQHILMFHIFRDQDLNELFNILCLAAEKKLAQQS